MPIYLKDVDIVPEVSKFQSALIVVCRFCPAASLAVANNQLFMEFFRRLLKTESYEQLINNMQSRLEKEGVKTDVFKGSIFNYLICMWTSGKRAEILRRASDYEAVVVMGCEAAYESVSKMIKSTDCQVFLGMESEGVMNVIPKLHWPFKISLELSGVTQMQHQKAE